MQKSYFTISVFGTPPVEVQIGTINKTSGQPNANSQRAFQELGEYSLPNYSTSWGILKKEKGILTGDIDFLPWGDPKGEQIELRMLRNCSSISLEYQRFKNIGFKEGKPFLGLEDDQAEIALKIGHNKFDEIIDKKLILMLKYHGLNRRNGSRNPANKRTTFETYQAGETQTSEVQFYENRQTAERIVMDVRTKSASLEILATLFDVDHDRADDLIFAEMMQWANEPNRFIEIWNGQTEKFKKLLTKSVDIGLISMESENVLLIVAGQKDILMTAVEGKNIDERIEYVTEEMLNPMYYYALERLERELERFNEAVLQ